MKTPGEWPGSFPPPVFPHGERDAPHRLLPGFSDNRANGLGLYLTPIMAVGTVITQSHMKGAAQSFGPRAVSQMRPEAQRAGLQAPRAREGPAAPAPAQSQFKTVPVRPLPSHRARAQRPPHQSDALPTLTPQNEPRAPGKPDSVSRALLSLHPFHKRKARRLSPGKRPTRTHQP